MTGVLHPRSTLHRRRSRSVRAAGAVLAVVAALVLASAGPAQAHASLVAADPPDGARLDRSPSRIELTFSEPVSVTLGGVRVLDGSGARVDRGSVRSRGPEVGVDLRGGLPDGTYVVTYRVVSDDGHPVRGSLVFAVGDGAVDPSVARLAGGDGDDRPWMIAGAVGRGIAYAGTLLTAGGVAFLLYAHRGGPDRPGLRRIVRGAAGFGVLGALTALPVQAALATGKGAGSLFEPGVLREVGRDGVGPALGLGVIGLVGAVALLDRNRILAGSAALVAAASFAATGHTRVGDLATPATVADGAHLVVVAVWGGGAVLLWQCLRLRRRADPQPDRSDTAAIVVRFSTLATSGVVLAGITGSFLAWNEVRSLEALVDTGYGRMLLVKLAAVAVIGAIAAYNHVRLLPALGQGKTRAALDRLHQAVRLESAILAVVIGLTSVLVVMTPARTDAAGGPVERIIELGDAGSVQLVVAPARAGSNQIHLYTFDPEGRPAELAPSIELELSLPAADLGPIHRTATRAGPAHAQFNGDDLTIAGRWTVTVRLRIDRFTEAAGTAEIDVAP